MSRNIRVGFDDLHPGDKVHLKGSNNVYELIRKYGVNDTADDTLVVGAPGIYQVVISRSVFDYATRPAPKKPKLRKPDAFGEYWIYSRVLGWLKMLYTESPFSRPGLFGERPAGDFTIFGTKVYRTNQFSRVLVFFSPTEILTAEEYYTRKIKGELCPVFHLEMEGR